MSESIEKLRAWVAEVKADHIRPASVCCMCGQTAPCDAARGAAVVKGAVRWADEHGWIRHDCLDAMVSALEGE
jgi:hypothetical protein